MRKGVLAAAGGALLAASDLVEPAQAVPISAPAALKDASESLALTENVYWGCGGYGYGGGYGYRPYYGGYGYGYRPYYRPYGYGYGRIVRTTGLTAMDTAIGRTTGLRIRRYGYYRPVLPALRLRYGYYAHGRASTSARGLRVLRGGPA